VAYWETYGWPDWMSQGLIDLATTYAEGFAPWFFLIAILGYGRRLLNRSGRVLSYLSEASYPYYILHQTLIVAIAFFVVRWDTSLGVKYVAILIGAGAATAVLYELIVKRTRITRALFGMRAKAASTPERSASQDSALASRPEGR
jgi:peptidoglycan/LPS O-acetylase OafA/YrhL